MRRISSIVAAIVALAFIDSAACAQNRQPIVSPEVHADGRITVRIRAPQANQVRLRGSLASGAPELTRGNDGVWSITTEPREPDIYNYVLLVDGVTTLDPENVELKMGIRGHQNMVEVRGERPSVWDAQDTPRGDIHIHRYDSKAMGVTRRVFVYTPPGYDADAASPYPVLYLLHGSGDDESSWTDFGRAHIIADNLIASGAARPMLIVMPFGHTSRGDSRSASDDERAQRMKLFSNDLLGDVIPLIEARYRVDRSAANRAIAGLSMGGGQSLYVGLTNVDRFGWVGAFSSAVRGDPDQMFASLAADPTTTNQKLQLLWIGCGEDDRLLDENEQFVAWLTANGIDHTWRLTAGGHSWSVWRRYLAEILPQLFQ